MRTKYIRYWPLLVLGIVISAGFLLRPLLTRANQDCTYVPGPPAEGQYALPQQDDWVDYGPVLLSGPPGAWDDGLGAAPTMSAVVRQGDTTFLYYVGFDGLRSTDGWERHRAIGVATSADGIRFNKHADSPIITHLPNNNEEESAGGMSVIVDQDGKLTMYWAASNAGNATSQEVIVDVKLATSDDGLAYTTQGDVLNHQDTRVWGYGDELFPVGIFFDGTNWNLYYIAKGLFGIHWDLGLAQGTAPDRLTQTGCVLRKGDGGNIYGGGSIVEIGPDTYALFLMRNNESRNNTPPYMEARTFSGRSPEQLSAPAATYNFPGFYEGSVVLDQQRRTWFMYYLDEADDYFEWTISLKLAPAGPRDTTPPTAPTDLWIDEGCPAGVTLAWKEATDSETGVVSYNIYRSGTKIGSSVNLHFCDHDAPPSAQYSVSAVNFHGVEGAQSTVLERGSTSHQLHLTLTQAQ
jgi:hypothetical protein